MEKVLGLTDRYGRIVELAPDVVYTLASNGTITSLCKSFQKITGWIASGWSGKHFCGLIHGDDQPLAREIF